MRETEHAFCVVQGIIHAHSEAQYLLYITAREAGNAELSVKYHDKHEALCACNAEVYKLYVECGKAAQPAAPATPEKKE